MALSPELKRMVSGAALDPLEAKRTEILARQAAARREVARLTEHNDEGDYRPSVRKQLAWLGFQKATKAELRQIIVNAMERDSEA